MAQTQESDQTLTAELLVKSAEYEITLQKMILAASDYIKW